MIELKSVRQNLKINEAQLVKILVAKKSPPTSPALATSQPSPEAHLMADSFRLNMRSGIQNSRSTG